MRNGTDPPVTAERIGDQRLYGVKADGLALTHAKSMPPSTAAPRFQKRKPKKKLEE